MFSESADHPLSKLSAQAGSVDLDMAPEALLANRDWLDLSKMAAEALDLVEACLEE